MKHRGMIMILGLLLAATFASAAEIHFSVTGTAYFTSNPDYIDGESYTFHWVLGDGYTGGDNAYFFSNMNDWYVESNSDPVLWTDVYGDNLAGTYHRSTAPYADLMVSADGVVLYASNGDPGSDSIGLTWLGEDVLRVQAYELTIPDIDYSATSFINPVEYFSDYLGTYAQSGGTIEVMTVNSHYAYFHATSLTVTPEPATMGLLLFGGAAALTRRRKKIVG